MIRRDMLIAGQRMADQYRVRSIGVECAVRLVCDLDRRQQAAAIEREGGGKAYAAREAETLLVGHGGSLGPTPLQRKTGGAMPRG